MSVGDGASYVHGRVAGVGAMTNASRLACRTGIRDPDTNCDTQRVRRRWLLAVPAVLVAAGAVAFGLVLLRGSQTTEVSVDEAVDEFREAELGESGVGNVASTNAIVTIAPVTSAVPVTAPPLRAPEPGVYVYATTGFDSVDALTGARHDYPAQTTVTISSEGCGVRVRWNTVRERWEEWQWCPMDGGIETVAYGSFHEFFGTSATTAYQCGGDPLPMMAATGTTWQMVCKQGDTDTSAFVGHVVETERINVGGTGVMTLHVRYAVTVSGGSTGTRVIDRWLHAGDGLVVREESTTETVQSTVLGEVHYEERYTMVLTSVTPQR